MEKSLKEKDEKRTKTFISGAVFSLLLFLSSLVFKDSDLFTLSVFIFISTLIIVIFIGYSGNSAILISGIQGEEKVRAQLRKILSSDYFVFYNYPSPHGDIDALVVGPTGVYVLEVKNINGHITVDGDNWDRIKIGRGGTAYKPKIGSPSLQAKRNATFVRDLLRENGINLRVQAIVVLANPEAKVNIVNMPEHVIVTDLNELGKIITEETAPTGKKNISAPKVKKIKEILCSINNCEKKKERGEIHA